jgi:hypothetical protein
VFFVTALSAQKTWTGGAGTSYWNNPGNWNPFGVPDAGDAVTILDNAASGNIIVDVNTTGNCASLSIAGGVNSVTITVKSNAVLNVTTASGGTGIITLAAPTGFGTIKTITMEGEGVTGAIINCTTISMGDISFPMGSKIVFNLNGGTVTTANFTMNGSGTENELKISTGKLALTGVFNSGGAFTPGTGTVEYNGAGQAMRSGTYYNLILKGSGGKSNAVAVNGKLSLGGTATVSNPVTYSAGATLEYNYPSPFISSNNEFPVSMPGSVIINSNIGLNSNKTIAGNLTLLSGILIAGNKLSMGNAGTPVITRDAGVMTGTLQTPANDYSVVYTGNSKTAGPELSSDGLKNVTVNLLSTAMLTLDQNRLVDGTLTITSGTLDLLAFTMNRTLGGGGGGALSISDGAKLKIGGTNTMPTNFTYALAPLSTVEYAGTNQLVTATTYGDLIAGGSGTKTVSISAATNVNGALSILPAVAFTIDAANFIAAKTVEISGTLNSTSVTGTKSFKFMTINSGGLFNSTVNENYTIERDLVVNGTGNIISGSGIWSFVAVAFQQTLGGTAGVTINRAAISGHYKHTGNFSFGTLGIGDGVFASLSNYTTLSISDALLGTGIFTQKSNSVLLYSGSTDINLTASNFIATDPGNVVNYCRNGNQSLSDANTYNNLILSGSGAKNFLSGVVINGSLSIQGTATLTSPGSVHYPTFGANATLEYAGSSAQTTTDIEFKSTGSPKNITINNLNSVTLHASKNFAGTLILTNGLFNIPAGNVLNLSGNNAVAGSFGPTTHINTMTTLVAGEAQGFLRVSNIPAGSAYLFPTGNGIYYLPATLTPTDVTANNTFSINVFQGITTSGLPAGVPVANKTNLVDAVWIINNNVGAATAAVTMTLGWPNALEGSGFSTLADNLIGISHFDNPAWGSYSGSGTQAANTATRTSITSFSPFSVGMIGTLLRGTNYLQPINKENTQKQNTVSAYHQVKSVSISPNPVSNTMRLRVVSDKKEKIEFVIASAEGKVIYKKIAELQPGSNNIRLDVAGLSKGMYFIKIFMGDEQRSAIKFVKS